MRIELLFEGKHPRPLEVLNMSNTLSVEFLCYTTKPSFIVPMPPQNSSRRVSTSWMEAPKTPNIKINSDVAFHGTTGKGTVGIVYRDDKGTIITASFKRIFASSPLVVEYLGLREAASLGRNLHLRHVILESDNQVLVETCICNQTQYKIKGIVWMIF